MTSFRRYNDIVVTPCVQWIIPFLVEDVNRFTYIVNSVAADGLVMQGYARV